MAEHSPKIFASEEKATTTTNTSGQSIWQEVTFPCQVALGQMIKLAIEKLT